MEPTISITEVYSSSSLLFWTIIAIVLVKEIRPEHASIFYQLKEPYMMQFNSEILKAPMPLQNIQALNYLITWPFPVERQPYDPSWLYSGIAVNAGLSIGLHNSKLVQPLRNANNTIERLRTRASTWLGCFYSNITLVPPQISTMSSRTYSYILGLVCLLAYLHPLPGLQIWKQSNNLYVSNQFRLNFVIKS